MTADHSNAQPTVSLVALKRLDAVCARFEADWQAGRKPRLEEYLDEVPQAERRHLFRELLQSEMELRAGCGLPANETIWCRRFPEYQDVITLVFAPTGDPPLPLTTPKGHPALPETLLGGSVRGKSTAQMALGKRGWSSRPERIGRYLLGQTLGRGGMGVVYLARHAQLDRQVAIKLLLGGGHLSASQLARFRAEATAVGHGSKSGNSRRLSGRE